MLPDSDSFDDILLPPAIANEAMHPSSDSLDDIFLPPVSTTEQKVGKFQPKARPKTRKPVPAPSNPSDAPRLISSIPKPPYAPGGNSLQEGSILFGGITGPPDFHAAKEYANQPGAIGSETLSSNDYHVEPSCNKESSEQGADIFAVMESPDDQLEPSTNGRVVDRFQLKDNCQLENKKLVTLANAFPGSGDYIGASSPISGGSAPDVKSSEAHVAQGPVQEAEEQIAQAESSHDRTHVSKFDTNLQTDPDNLIADETSALHGRESLDDVLFQPCATSECTLGIFRPKLRPKIIKPVPASSNCDAIRPLSSAFGAPILQACDAKCPEEGLRLSNSAIASSTMEIHDSKFDATQESVNYHETLPSVMNVDNEVDSQGNQGKSGEVVDMFISMETLDGDVHCAPTKGVVESMDASNLSSSSSAPLTISSELNVSQEPRSATKELATHEDEHSQHGPLFSESVLQTDPDEPEEAITMFSGMEPFDDIFVQPVATAVKLAGKDQSDFVSRPNEQKAKSVSFVLPPAAAESVSLPAESHSEELACPSTAADPPSGEIMSDAFLDKPRYSSSVVSDCTADFDMDHGRLEKEDTAEFSGLKTLDNILSQPTLTTDKAWIKFRPKPSARTKNVKPNDSVITHGATESLSSQRDSLLPETESLEGHKSDFPSDPLVDSTPMWTGISTSSDLCDEQANLIETSTLEVQSPGSNQVLEDRTSEDNVIGGKRKFMQVPEGTCNGAHYENVEETHGEKSTSKTVEDDEASKSSRKLRKRIDVSRSFSELDGRSSENWDVENSGTSQMDEDHSDDAYRGEDMPKQKRAVKKAKRQMTENKRPVRRRKKTSEEPDSKAEEPPKAKFPHSTRRKRRQVNKALLEMPDHEIDPRQLSIKDLIMLAEAKERISNKEASVQKNSFPNQSNASSFCNDTYFDEDNNFGEEHYQNYDGAEEEHNIQLKPKKLNYHSYMNRQQSGRWSKSETELFYQAIRQFGTDFAMIQQLFPNRTRHQVKLKFKNEERKHPLQVADAIVHRSKDNSHFERVIQLLQAQAEQNDRVERDDDPSTVSQDAADGNEALKERQEPNKEEDGEAANGCQGSPQDPVKYGDWDRDDECATNYNEFESGFGWDANASSPQEMEKDIYGQF